MSISDGTCAYAAETLANTTGKWLKKHHDLSGPHANSLWKSDGTCAHAAEVLVNMIQKWSSFQHHLNGPHAGSLTMSDDSST